MEDLRTTLVELGNDIRRRDGYIKELDAFFGVIQERSECFDSQEVEATRLRLHEETTQRVHLVNRLRDKLKIYDEQVVQLHSRLEERKRVLEEHPEPLKGAPDLLSVFVKTHKDLECELSQAREALLQ